MSSKNLSNSEIEMELIDKPTNRSFPILVIDDDKMIQRLIASYLTGWGFTPISAFDAFKGISLAIKYRPIMIFLDIMMPEVNGEVALKIIKEIELTQNIPVVIISGNIDKSVLSSTFSRGASGFISKPFTRDIMYQKIKENLHPSISMELKEAFVE